MSVSITHLESLNDIYITEGLEGSIEHIWIRRDFKSTQHFWIRLRELLNHLPPTPQLNCRQVWGGITMTSKTFYSMTLYSYSSLHWWLSTFIIFYIIKFYNYYGKHVNMLNVCKNNEFFTSQDSWRDLRPFWERVFLGTGMLELNANNAILIRGKGPRDSRAQLALSVVNSYCWPCRW